MISSKNIILTLLILTLVVFYTLKDNNKKEVLKPHNDKPKNIIHTKTSTNITKKDIKLNTQEKQITQKYTAIKYKTNIINNQTTYKQQQKNKYLIQQERIKNYISIQEKENNTIKVIQDTREKQIVRHIDEAIYKNLHLANIRDIKQAKFLKMKKDLKNKENIHKQMEEIIKLHSKVPNVYKNLTPHLLEQ